MAAENRPLPVLHKPISLITIMALTPFIVRFWGLSPAWTGMQVLYFAGALVGICVALDVFLSNNLNSRNLFSLWCLRTLLIGHSLALLITQNEVWWSFLILILPVLSFVRVRNRFTDTLKWALYFLSAAFFIVLILASKVQF
ncbi:MAG: hypothetical protein AB7G93_01250 [Bdellovibrionales bacterium]